MERNSRQRPRSLKLRYIWDWEISLLWLEQMEDEAKIISEGTSDSLRDIGNTKEKRQMLLRTLLLGHAWNAVTSRIRSGMAGCLEPKTESMTTNSMDSWEETGGMGRPPQSNKGSPKQQGGEGLMIPGVNPCHPLWRESWCPFSDQCWDRDFWREKYILLCVRILGP